MSRTLVTLVLDIGKSRAKLLAIDDDGTLLGHWQQASTSVDVAEGYRALDTSATEAWLCDSLAQLGELRSRIRAIVPISHGAAIAGIDGRGLVLPVPDYEFSGFDQRRPDWLERIDPFEQCLSPVLPQGLNMATQLDWLDRMLPTKVAQVRHWMPYPQYWAWWLSGVASNEVSSLGCHSLLWRPRHGDWSELALRSGWAARFAPMHRAWENLGILRPALARRFGLPADVNVLCGAHDSNACLARYLRSWPRMTLVSTGTWVVVMAPAAPVARLGNGQDFLVNVSVRGEAVPTGRFMGGREYERLCAGDDPGLATFDSLRNVLAANIRVLPQARGVRMADGRGIPPEEMPQLFSASERAALASLCAAQATAEWAHQLGTWGSTTVDGPFAANPVYLKILASLLDGVHASSDPVDGTARGGWALGLWTKATATPPLVSRIEPDMELRNLLAHRKDAKQRVCRDAATQPGGSHGTPGH